jgi:predicted metal-dependent phosphoesterase TrpH
LVKADLHIHTCYSMDCSSSLQQIIDRCMGLGINCLAIADHGTIAGAMKIREICPFTIIIAEEVLTPDGEIMGMFLSEEIPTRISAEETIRRIKDQGGLVCIPHPFDLMRSSAFNNSKSLEAIMPSVDIIEVFNARSLDPGSELKGRRLMKKFGKLASAGSDAHTPSEIGNVYIEMPLFKGKEEFLRSLAQGIIIGRKANPLVHLESTKNKLRKRFTPRK